MSSQALAPAGRPGEPGSPAALAPAESLAGSLADQPSLSPSIPAADLSNRARRARALLGLAIGLAFLAAAAALGLWLAAAVFHSGGLG